MFLVRGHTHNRLDAANKEVSSKYFAASEITTLLQMVNLNCKC